MNTVRNIVIAAAFLAAPFLALPPAHAGPIQWCDPASPLFDPTICYNESPRHGGYSCDPYGPAYDPNYCAAQR